MKALLVSRTPQARAWIAAALGSDWETDEAADGLEALRIVRDEDVDLVVADQSTEPFGAFGLARELKILEWPPGVIIVLDRAQDVWLAKWSGADRWLLQPVDPFALRRVADEVMAVLDADAADAGAAVDDASAAEATA